MLTFSHVVSPMTTKRERGGEGTPSTCGVLQRHEREAPTDAELRGCLHRLRDVLNVDRRGPDGWLESSNHESDGGGGGGLPAAAAFQPRETQSRTASWEARLQALDQLREIVMAASVPASPTATAALQEQHDIRCTKCVCDISTRSVFRAEVHTAFQAPLLRHLEDPHSAIQAAAAKVLAVFFERASDAGLVTSLSNTFTKPLLRLTASTQPGVARAAATALQTILGNHFGAQAFRDLVRAASRGSMSRGASFSSSSSPSSSSPLGSERPNPRARCHALHAILYATRHVPGTAPHAVVLQYVDAIARVIQQGLEDPSDAVRGAAALAYWGLFVLDSSIAASLLSTLSTFTKSRVLACRTVALDVVGVVAPASAGQMVVAEADRMLDSGRVFAHDSTSAVVTKTTDTTAAESGAVTEVERALETVSARAARRAARRSAAAAAVVHADPAVRGSMWEVWEQPHLSQSQQQQDGPLPSPTGGALQRRVGWGTAHTIRTTAHEGKTSPHDAGRSERPLTVDDLFLLGEEGPRERAARRSRCVSAPPMRSRAPDSFSPPVLQCRPHAVLRSGAATSGAGAGRGRWRQASEIHRGATGRPPPTNKEGGGDHDNLNGAAAANRNRTATRARDDTDLMTLLESDDWKHREFGLQRLQTTAASSPSSSLWRWLAAQSYGEDVKAAKPSPRTRSDDDGSAARSARMHTESTTEMMTQGRIRPNIRVEAVLERVIGLLNDGIRRVGQAALRSIAALLAWLSAPHEDDAEVVTDEAAVASVCEDSGGASSPPPPPPLLLRQFVIHRVLRLQLPAILLALAEVSLSSHVTSQTLVLACLSALWRSIFPGAVMLVGVCQALLAEPPDRTGYPVVQVPVKARLLDLLRFVLEEGHRTLTLHGADDLRWISQWLWPALVPLLLQLSSSSSCSSSLILSRRHGRGAGDRENGSAVSHPASSSHTRLLQSSLASVIIAAYVAAPAALTRCVAAATAGDGGANKDKDALPHTQGRHPQKVSATTTKANHAIAGENKKGVQEALIQCLRSVVLPAGVGATMLFGGPVPVDAAASVSVTELSEWLSRDAPPFVMALRKWSAAWNEADAGEGAYHHHREREQENVSQAYHTVRRRTCCQEGEVWKVRAGSTAADWPEDGPSVSFLPRGTTSQHRVTATRSKATTVSSPRSSPRKNNKGHRALSSVEPPGGLGSLVVPPPPPAGLSEWRLFRSTLSPQYQLDDATPPIYTVLEDPPASSVQETLHRYLQACAVSPAASSFVVGEEGFDGDASGGGTTATTVAGALLAGLHFHYQALQGGHVRGLGAATTARRPPTVEQRVLSSPEFSCEALLECVQYHMGSPAGCAGWAEEPIVRLLVRRLHPFLLHSTTSEPAAKWMMRRAGVMSDGAGTAGLGSRSPATLPMSVATPARSGVRRRAFGVVAVLLRSPALQCFLPPLCEQCFRWCRHGMDDPFIEVQQAAAGCLRALLYATTVPLDTCLNGLAACLEGGALARGSAAVVTEGWLELLRSVGRLFERASPRRYAVPPPLFTPSPLSSRHVNRLHDWPSSTYTLSSLSLYTAAPEAFVPVTYKSLLDTYIENDPSAAPACNRWDTVTRTVFLRLAAVLRAWMEQPALPTRVRDVCVRVLAVMRWVVPAAVEVYPLVLSSSQVRLVNAFCAEVH